MLNTLFLNEERIKAIWRTNQMTGNGISFAAPLQDQTGVIGEPLGVAGNTGETSRETLLASSGGTEADNSDLVVSAIGTDEAQWAARVTLQY